MNKNLTLRWIVTALLILIIGLTVLSRWRKTTLERQTEISMQDFFDNSEEYSEFDMQVLHVDLVRSGGHTWKGFADVAICDDHHNIMITATSEGFLGLGLGMWNTEPGAMAFMLKYVWDDYDLNW